MCVCARDLGALLSPAPPLCRGLFTSCMHPRAGHGGISRRHDDEYGDDDEDDEVSEVDSEIARQVASEEAGMKLNYKHRKLDGE